ncbi:MAG TPA: DUF3558 family protein, partial [Pseudonocardiaceae bacterium]|nr:DUF3558 family protein [Pseudonocardiaceae bacterium]
AVLLAGCSSGAGGGSTTTMNGGSSSSSSGTSTAGAPTVSNPLDASKFLHSPCSALTVSDVSGLGISGATGSPRMAGAGPQCDWTGDSGAGIDVIWTTGSTGGLDNGYKLQAAAAGKYFAYFQPTTVGNYPAVYAATSDDRSSGDCVLNVGVSANTSFLSQYNGSTSASQACSLAAKAAADVIKNLGGS